MRHFSIDLSSNLDERVHPTLGLSKQLELDTGAEQNWKSDVTSLRPQSSIDLLTVRGTCTQMLRAGAIFHGSVIQPGLPS